MSVPTDSKIRVHGFGRTDTLYRLAQSKYRERFVLKGAMLFAVRVGEPEPRRGKWSVVDVLYDQLGGLGGPILGGLPFGHGPHPHTIPVGTMAALDTAARTLTVVHGDCRELPVCNRIGKTRVPRGTAVETLPDPCRPVLRMALHHANAETALQYWHG